MENNNRNRIIQEGIKNNKGVKQINKELRIAGEKEYNPLLYKENYKNWNNWAKDFKSLGRDFSTMGGAIIDPIRKTVVDVYKAPSYLKTQVLQDALTGAAKSASANNKRLSGMLKGAAEGYVVGKAVPKIGGLAGIVTGGIMGLVGEGDMKKGAKDVTNSILSTYNTSIDKINKGEFHPLDIAQGAFNHPVMAAMDFAPLYMKPAGKLINATTSRIPKNAPKFVQQIFPSKEYRNFNRALTNSINYAKGEASELYNGITKLEASPWVNREEIVNYIRSNKANLSKGDLQLAKRLRKDLINNQKYAIKQGLLSEQANKDDIISQYVMHNIAGNSDLLHGDVRNIIQGKPLRATAKQIIKENKLKNELNQLIKEGEELYNKDKIAFLSQKLAPSVDPRGEVLANVVNEGAKDYFDTSRVIGRSSAKDIGDVLDETVKFQLDQVGKSREALQVVDDLLENPEIGKTLLTGKVDKNVIISDFKNSIMEDIARGEAPNITKALKRTGMDKTIDKMYYEAVKNAFDIKASGAGRRLLNAFKKAVLATPHWFVLNRAGNWTNNAMNGVTLRDYLDTRKYKGLAPKQLKLQTSFGSYINEGTKGKEAVKSTWGVPLNRLGKAGKKFWKSDKGLKDIGDLVFDTYSSLSDLTANPMFRWESAAEFTDRYANFIRQAKREVELRKSIINRSKMSKAQKAEKLKGVTVENILKQSDKDKALFNKLNTEVNKSLGDYVGRNYLINNGIYNTLSEAIPFYRFLAQTGRTTLHQMAHKPLALAGISTIPTRVGGKISDNVIKEYGLDPDEYEGGVPYLNQQGKPYVDQNGNIRLMRFEPIPVGAVGLQLSDWMQGKNLQSALNPAISTLPDVLQFKVMGRTATNPRLNYLRDTDRQAAKNFQPTLAEVLKLGGSKFLSSTFNPYIVGTRILPEISATFSGKGLQSRYDTDPFKINPKSYNRDLPLELLGRNFGVQMSSGKKPERVSKSAMRRNRKSEMYSRQKEKNAKKSKRGT